ncbi:hypothetical protein F8388_001469 [Cannabis sativa]|uniref:Pentatricopeptide repeat-containing protein n=1 Tax=Cannabis sativa TaxID=3483 RepID=A0A7J6GMY6_CANSA|nr:hypothetical protein F8388_001469 [Cannabis sativa]
MWRLIPKKLYWLPTRSATPNPIVDARTSIKYCSTQSQSSVKEICNILTQKNWKFLMDSSYIPNKLNPKLIRSVIRHNRLVEPKRLLDFFIRSETKKGTSQDLEVLSLLSISLSTSVVDVFLSLKSVEFLPSFPSCNLLLKELLRTTNMGLFWKVHDGMLKMKISSYVFTYSNVIEAYFRASDVDGAKGAFLEMDEKGCSPNGVTYNMMISGLCRAVLVGEAVEMKKSMAEKGLVPDKYTYVTLINGYCGKRKLVVASKLLREIPYEIAYNPLIDGFMKIGNVEEACRIKDEMVKYGIRLGLINYNTIPNGVCKADLMSKARDIVDEMIKMGSIPDSRTYTSLIEGYSGNKRNLAPTIVTYRILINGLCRGRNIDQANDFLKEMVSFGLKTNSVIYNTLISAQAKAGKFEEARGLLDKMKEQGILPNVFCYNSLIMGLCRENKLEAARICWDEMLARGLKPNAFTFGAFVRAYTNVGDMEMADKYINEMLAYGLVSNDEVYVDLIDGQYKKGNLTEANLVLMRMLAGGILPVVQTYWVLINGLSRNGKVLEALSILSELCEKGLNPDVYICNSLITRFYKQGDVDMAMLLLDEMHIKGVNPNIMTYNVLINGLCKAGDVE